LQATSSWVFNTLAVVFDVYARNLYALTHVTEYFPSVYLYLLESPPLEGARFWKLYNGTWLLYKGVRAKEDYFYFQKKIAEVQSQADKARNVDEYEAQEELNREKRRLFKKLTRRLLHLYRNLASHLLKRLHDQGVSTIYLGYPYNIAQDKGSKFTSNLWSYRKLINAIELKAQEYGMKVYEVVEYNTSRFCAYHDVEVKRHPRGVVSCPKGHKLHSDLNGALNILKKVVGVVVSTVKKPLSFLVLHNGVAPVKGCNT